MFLRVLSALICGLFLYYGWNGDSKAATIYVTDNFKSIQDAIDNAPAGDTIVVRDGEYRGNIVVSKPVVLISENGPEKTIATPVNSAEPVFRIFNTSNVVISGFTVTGSSAAGIYLENVTGAEIKNNRTLKNRNGIFLYSSNRNTLTNNKSDFNYLTGIYLESSHENTIMSNETNTNNEKGIFLNSSNNNIIMNNIANRNQWNGITMWVSNNNRVEKNEVMRNTYSIIISGSAGNVVTDNYTWTNLYIILPIILIYVGIILFFIQRKIFTLIYSEPS